MSRNCWRQRLLTAVTTAAMFAGLTALTFGQESSPQRVPMIEDWSTHHLVFSHPGTFEQATQTRPFLEWYRALSDPRYQMELARRNADLKRGAGGASVAVEGDYADDFKWGGRLPPHRPRPLVAEQTKPEGDWNNFLGGTANAGIGATLYPAKYTWNINAAPNCTSDFLVVPVNQAPASQANATGTIVIHSEPAEGDTITIGSTVYGWHAANNNCSAAPLKCVARSAATGTDATDLEEAVNGTCFNGACTADPAVTATVNGSTVTLVPTAAYDGSTGNVGIATTDDAAIYLNNKSQASSTLTGGVDGQASIIAFNSLYSGGGADASQTGTVTANSASSGQTVTVGALTLTASAGTQATGKVTIVTNPTNANDVYIDIGTTGTTIESDIYALHDKLGDCGAAANCVLIGSTTTATAANLAAAIMGSCLNTCSPSPNVTATSSGNVVTLTAIVMGTAGNSIPLSSNIGGTGGTGDVTVSGADLGGGSGTLTATEFAYSGLTTTQLAANIVTAINANSSTAGATAASIGNVITVTATTGGLGSAGPPETGNYITVGGTLSGFTWGGTTLAGGTAPGFCGTGQPAVLWAYKASTASSPMLGSPILSYDGTKVAFIESASTGAILHVLHWKSGNGGTNLGATPVLPTTSTTTGATYTSCLSAGTTSCMFNLALGTYNNTNSPPFYDYNTDALFVGDNNGTLRKVTGVFGGTPAVAWSATVNSGAILSGAVEDISNGNILVGDSTGRLSMVSSAGVVSGTTLTGLGDITDPVMVDPFTGHVFVFSGGNGTSAVVEEATNVAHQPGSGEYRI